jgi:hypothetical protein
MYVVSLGTDKVAKSYNLRKRKALGYIPLGHSSHRHAQNHLWCGSSQLSGRQTFRSRRLHRLHIRIVPAIGGVTHKMDDASTENIAKIKTAGHRYIKENAHQLDKIVNHFNKLKQISSLEGNI